jgi:hypothetical protein
MSMNFVHPSNRKIGVLLSGGMDSALMLYLVTKEAASCIQPFTVAKHDGASLYVQPIVNWISNRLHISINDPIIIGNPNLYHDRIIGDALTRVIRHNLADVFYVGDNIYPENELPGGPIRVKHPHHMVKYPLFHLTKIDIVQLYLKHNLLDLLSLTHTCTEQAIGRCTVCWQCRERAWAFKQCEMEDLTTT